MRFVVLHHTGWQGRGDHFDLLLEIKEGRGDDDLTLQAFATLTDEFPDGKSHADFYSRGTHAGDPCAQANLLRMLSRHRRAYLHTEGSIGGDRGSVKRVDQGTFEWIRQPDQAWTRCDLRLSGQVLDGEYRLRHMGSGTFVFERKKRVGLS